MIAGDIVAQLDRSSLMQANEVKVAVVNGFVTLSGTVASYVAEKRAYDAAASLSHFWASSIWLTSK